MTEPAQMEAFIAEHQQQQQQQQQQHQQHQQQQLQFDQQTYLAQLAAAAAQQAVQLNAQAITQAATNASGTFSQPQNAYLPWPKIQVSDHMLLKELSVEALARWGPHARAQLTSQGVLEDNHPQRNPTAPTRFVLAEAMMGCDAATSAYEAIKKSPPPTWEAFIAALSLHVVRVKDALCIDYDKLRETMQQNRAPEAVPGHIASLRGLLARAKTVQNLPKGANLTQLPTDNIITSNFTRDLHPEFAAKVRVSLPNHWQEGHIEPLFQSVLELVGHHISGAASTPTPQPDAMDLSALRAPFTKRLSPEERQRRIATNSCLACGLPGHFKNDPICAVSGRARKNNNTTRTNNPRPYQNKQFHAMQQKLDALTEKLSAMGIVTDDQKN